LPTGQQVCCITIGRLDWQSQNYHRRVARSNMYGVW
jgi:hypothetical protein